MFLAMMMILFFWVFSRKQDIRASDGGSRVDGQVFLGSVGREKNKSMREEREKWKKKEKGPGKWKVM